jgi:transposase
MRVAGLDIHRIFAKAVMPENGTGPRRGRVGMTCDHLTEFAGKFAHGDRAVVEATARASAVAEVIRP